MLGINKHMKLDPYKYNRTDLRARHRYENRYTTQDYPGTLMPVGVNRRYRPYKDTWPLPPGFLDKVVGQPRTVVEDYIRVRTEALSSDKRAGIRNYLRYMVREDMFLCMGVPCYYTDRGITPIPRGLYYYHEDILYMVPAHVLPNGKRRLSPYRKYPYLDKYVDALHIHQPMGAALIQQTMKCVFILHVGEKSYDELEDEFEDVGYPDPYPPRMDHIYKCSTSDYLSIGALWWVSDSPIVPEVGWYLDVPMEPLQGTRWGLDAKVVRIKLCSHYDSEGYSHVLINCRVVYEEG
jgi:hypothetical protein